MGNAWCQSALQLWLLIGVGCLIGLTGLSNQREFARLIRLSAVGGLSPSLVGLLWDTPVETAITPSGVG